MEKATIIIMIVFVVGLIVWDIYAAVKGGGKATISYIIAKASKSYPIIAFALGLAVGVLAGHFWPITSMCQ